jgi:putative endonuclease
MRFGGSRVPSCGLATREYVIARFKRAIQQPRALPMGIDRSYWVYILASDVGGTLYIGVTNDLVRRVYEHRTDAVPRFSGRYCVHRLVYYEQFGDIEFALRCEKYLNKWNRAWKIELI